MASEPGGLKETLYKVAARELAMHERPEFVKNAVDMVLESLWDSLLGDIPEEAVEAVWREVNAAIGLPYMARIREYVSDDSTGADRERELAALRLADAEADRENRAFVERVLQEAFQSLRTNLGGTE